MATKLKQVPQPAIQSGDDLGQGLYISCLAQDVNALVDTFEQWFASRDDITLVDSGTSKKGRGFVILEWDRAVDRRVLNWLSQQEIVDDFSLYAAYHGQEERA